MNQNDRSFLEAALVGYQAQRTEIEAKIQELRAQVQGDRIGNGLVAAGRPKRTMSAAARKRIAAAQRKRWAAFKKAKAGK